MKTQGNTEASSSPFLLSEAKTCYEALSPNYVGIGNYNYWKLGCAMDSIIDFLNLAGQNNIVSFSDGRTFLKNAASYYMTNKKQGEWYDDWAWWGNATGKVFSPRYSNLFDTDLALRINFSAICKQTFNFIKSGTAPYKPMDYAAYVGSMKAYDYAVSQQAENPTSGWKKIVTDAEPMWNIGCWQAPMIAGVPFYDPFYTGLGPFQDSVVNGLFYILAQRTLNQNGLGTQEDVDVMTQFYSNWMGFGSVQLQPDQQIFMRFGADAGLFRERISIYKNGTNLLGYNPNLAWTGDQGLMLIALTQLFYKQSGPQQHVTLNLITQTINGVIKHAVCDIQPNYRKVIMPWINIIDSNSQQLGPPPGNDPGDYFSGTGIFMRGLLEASSIPAIKQYVSTNAVQEVLGSTVSALRNSTVYKDYVLGQGDQQDNFFDNFNKLATFVTASQLLITVAEK